jgi:hypothetical protein
MREKSVTLGNSLFENLPAILIPSVPAPTIAILNHTINCYTLNYNYDYFDFNLIKI